MLFNSKTIYKYRKEKGRAEQKSERSKETERHLKADGDWWDLMRALVWSSGPTEKTSTMTLVY